MAKEKLELNNLSDQDLESRIAESELRLKKLKFTHVVSPLENPLDIRELRREIARVKTWGTKVDRKADYEAGSPSAMCNMPQHLFEPLISISKLQT